MRKDQYKHGRVIVSRLSYDHNAHTRTLYTDVNTIPNASRKTHNFPKGLRGNGSHTYMMLPLQCGKTVRASYPHINKPSETESRPSKKRDFASLGYIDDNPWSDGLEDMFQACDEDALMYTIDDLCQSNTSTDADNFTTLDETRLPVVSHNGSTQAHQPLSNDQLRGSEKEASEQCEQSSDDSTNQQTALNAIPDETHVTSYLTDYPLLGTSPVSSELTDDFCKLGSLDDWCFA